MREDEHPIVGRLIAGGLPLLVYPFVALASVMSLGGYTTGAEPVLLMIVARGFQIGSLAYPLVYFGCLVAALVVRKNKKALAAKLASAPLWYLGTVCLLMLSWMMLGR